MKTKMEALTNAFYPISTRIYQEAQAAQGAAGGQGFDPNNMGGSAPHDDGTVDADYEVVDDEN
jgi:molecular chaperone DnaK